MGPGALASSVLAAGKLLRSPATSSISAVLPKQGNPAPERALSGMKHIGYKTEKCVAGAMLFQAPNPPGLCTGDLKKRISKEAVSVAFFYVGGGRVL